MVLGLDLQPFSIEPLHAQLSNLQGQRIWGPLDIHVLNTESGRLVEPDSEAMPKQVFEGAVQGETTMGKAGAMPSRLRTHTHTHARTHTHIPVSYTHLTLPTNREV